MQDERQIEVSRAATLNAKHLALASAGHVQQAPNAVLAMRLMLGDKHGQTRVHSENLSRYGVAFGSRLQLSEANIESLWLGGIIHDYYGLRGQAAWQPVPQQVH